MWSWWVQKISVEFEVFVEFMKFEGFLELVELVT